MLTFHEASEAFVGQYLQGNENARYDLINYVRQVKKPKDIDVISFQIYLESMNSAAAWFPRNSEILGDEDFKIAFHTAMPSITNRFYVIFP